MMCSEIVVTFLRYLPAQIRGVLATIYIYIITIHIYSDFHTDYKTIKNTCLGTFDLTVLIN